MALPLPGLSGHIGTEDPQPLQKVLGSLGIACAHRPPVHQHTVNVLAVRGLCLILHLIHDGLIHVLDLLKIPGIRRRPGKPLPGFFLDLLLPFFLLFRSTEIPGFQHCIRFTAGVSSGRHPPVAPEDLREILQHQDKQLIGPLSLLTVDIDLLFVLPEPFQHLLISLLVLLRNLPVVIFILKASLFQGNLLIRHLLLLCGKRSKKPFPFLPDKKQHGAKKDCSKNCQPRHGKTAFLPSPRSSPHVDSFRLFSTL